MRAPLSPPEALGLAGYWYAAAPSSRVGAEPLTVNVCGEPLTLVREGTVRPVDGWMIAESDGYVWAQRGEAASPPPSIDALRQPGRAFVQRTCHFDASQRLVMENALDFAHSAFAHPWSQPSWFLHRLGKLPALVARYRQTSDGLFVEGRLGPWVLFHHSFHLPDRLRLVMLPNSRFHAEIVTHQIPQTARSCRMEVLFSRPAMPWESAVPTFETAPLSVLEEDRVLVEAQQKLLDRLGPFQEAHGASDAYTLLLRRILDAAEEGRSPEEGEWREVKLRL